MFGGRGLGVRVEIKGDAKQLSSELGGASDDVKGFGLNIGGSALKMAGFATAVGGAALVIADLTSAAAEDQAEQDRLTQAIIAAGAATGDYTKQVDDAISAGQDRAFTDTQTRDALQSLVTATGDVTTATAELSTAQDIARFAGVDLATAADAVAKAHAGQDGALRKLMPGLAKGKDATETLANASRLAAGQADKYANSAQGMQARATDAFSEIGETIGSAFLPMLQEILPSLLPVIKQLGVLVQAILPVIIPLLKLLGSALGIVARALSTVVGWLTRLIGWLNSAIGAVGRFLDSINPLKGISLPSLPFLGRSSGGGGGGALGSRARGVPFAGGGSSGGGVVINIHGDPDVIRSTVIDTLRAYDRRNGLAGTLIR